MEGGEEFPMDDEEIPDAAPPPQVQEQMLPMEHFPGVGGGELDVTDMPCLEVEEEQQPPAVAGEEEDGGSTAEEEGDRGPAGAEMAEEGAGVHWVEVEDEVVDDEGPLGLVAPLTSASDAAEGEEETAGVGRLPFVVEDTAEEEEQVQDEEQQEEKEERGPEGADVLEERAVSHGMEAEDEGISARESENVQLPALAPLSSNFVEAEESEEPNSLGPSPAVEDEVIADNDVAEEDEEEEEEAASAMSTEERELTASVSGGRSRGGGRKKRGRPPKAQASRLPTKKKEEEDLCFICFDGGNLVVCDRR